MEEEMGRTEGITFISEDGEEVLFEILEQTRLAGVDYLLVASALEDGEAEALILKDKSQEDDIEAIYEIIEDEQEIKTLASVFKELIGDIDFEIE